MKTTVLFICFQNSARSQMAEAMLNHYAPNDFTAESAGIEAGELNPLAVEVMAEIGIDISGHRTRGVREVVKTGRVFGYIISLGEEAGEGRCAIVPRSMDQGHWELPNPVPTEGQEPLSRMREVRDLLSQNIKNWCNEHGVTVGNSLPSSAG